MSPRSYQRPDHEDAFEELCLHLFRRHWNCPALERYGHRGQRQHGVDLLDLGGAIPLRAIQCKYHAPHKEISPEELRTEVEKAKDFPIKIDNYYFVTTAKKGKDAQLEQLKINRAHQSLGLFTVEVLTWEGIERLFDQYPEVWARTESLPSSVWVEQGAQTSTKLDMLTRLMVSTNELISDATSKYSTDIESELTEIKTHIENYEYQIANLLLHRIQSKHWDQLQPRQKYRVLLYFANLLLADGKVTAAAEKLLDAKKLQPGESKALAYEALAYELLEDRAKAHELANKVLKENPALSDAAAVLVRTASPGKVPEEIIGEVMPAAIDEEVAVAFSTLCLQRHRYDLARDYAKLATDKKPDWSAAWLARGKAEVAEEFAKLSRNAPGLVRHIDYNLISSADACLEKAIEQGRACQNSFIVAESLIIRSQIFTLRNQDILACKAIEDAYEILPDNPEVLAQYARVQIEKKDTNGAIALLRRAVALANNSVTKMILATLLAQAGDQSSRAEALLIFKELATHVHAPYQVDAALYSLQLTTRDFSSSAVGELLDYLQAHLKPAVLFALRGTLAQSLGLIEQARQHAIEAHSHIDDNTTAGEIMIIANLLTQLDVNDMALTCWQRITMPGVYKPETRNLIVCADRLGRHDILLSIYKDLRHAGVFEEDFFHNEVSLLAQYDPLEAIHLLADYLSKHPNDQITQIILYSIAHRIGRSDLIHLNLDIISQIREIRSEWMEPIVEMFQEHSPSLIDAVHIAYRILGSHFSKPEAHMAFLRSMGLPHGKGPDDIEQPQEVTIDCAVAYVESDSAQIYWMIIEDPRDGTNFPEETASPHGERAKLFLNHRVGDEITVTSSAIQDRKVTIKSIMHKYVYRLNDSLEKWQVRFPHLNTIQQVREKNNEDAGSIEIKFSSMLRFAKARKDRIDSIVDFYDKNIIPIHILSKQLGGDYISMMWQLADDRNRQIRCRGTEMTGPSSIVSSLESSTRVIIDVTAIATISKLKLSHILIKSPATIFCSYGVCDEIRHCLAENPHARVTRANQHSEGSRQIEDSLVYQELVQVKDGITIIDARPLAALEPKMRDELTEMFGHATAESISIASQPHSLLWTDDATVDIEARRRLDVQSVSTANILEYWRQEGAITQAEYYQACARLLAWNYAPSPVSIEILLAAAQMTNWNTRVFPFDFVLDIFSRDNIPKDGIVRLASLIIVAVYKEIDLSVTRDLVVVNMLNRIKQRKDRRAIVASIRACLAGAFGVNVLGLADAQRCIGAWLQTL